MVSKLQTQAYKYLLDVVELGYSVDYIYAIALVHSRPGKLLVQALDWNIIDSETYNKWSQEIL